MFYPGAKYTPNDYKTMSMMTDKPHVEHTIIKPQIRQRETMNINDIVDKKR
jgi:hypothetical protein